MELIIGIVIGICICRSNDKYKWVSKIKGIIKKK
jgi:hypothetical protein